MSVAERTPQSAGAGVRRSAFLAGLLALAAAAPLVVVAAPTTHTVTIDGTRFSPETLTVQRGDRVVWMNKDPFPHTATATSKAFDSGSIAAGKSWRWTARTAGTYDYVCSFHPTMKGALIVR